MEELLKSRLKPVDRRRRSVALGWQLAACWSVAALAAAGCMLARAQLGWSSPLTLPVLAALAGAAATALILRQGTAEPDYRALAKQVEQKHPELNGLLLTAVQQPAAGGSSGYLQRRLLDQALAHSRERDWRGVIPRSRVRLAQGAQLAALGGLIAALGVLRSAERRGAPAGVPRGGVVVTPGDTSLERGESLVVLARFGGSLPAGVTMVVRTSGSAPQSIALVKSLADPVFGGSVPEVDQDLTYHLEYGSRATPEYKVSVFEHPRLERADAVLTYPAYTHLAPKRIENTRRVSAVEGTQLDLSLQLNKPVASAELIAQDAKKTVVPLRVAADRAVASLPAFALVATQTYELRLVDRDGRTNKLSTPFVIDVSPDRPPELHVTAPHGDLRPSPIEEIGFTGTVLGEFGVSAYGLAYSVAGADPKVVDLGRAAPAMEKRDFQYTLSLENLGVRPDQLVSWYVWADDTGPDGKPRRTTGDLYFAEIRPFDEIFRENKGMSPSDQQGNAPDQGGDNQKLTELQKQIISATWKLQRDPAEPKYADDTKVVHDSQADALAQAGDSRKEAEDPRAQALWTAVTQSMQRALAQLDQAGKSPTALAPALGAEQAAYQNLLSLQARETQVSRGRSGGRGRGGASQRQLDQLDLTQEQNRYETQRDAAPAESPEQRERLQVMNRLQELARRQQDVNDRLKEMQTALQEARTDQEREELRQQLKRLQDEQQQVLADTDELRQRLDQQENRSNMSEQRRQLDQTRSDVQQAAEAAGQGAVAQALDAGTRAQRQFQDMREQLHQQNSSQFADDLRAMRAQARELADQEAALGQQLGASDAGGQPKRLSDTADAGGPAQALAAQKQRLTDLVNRAKQVSQQAENSEPLLAEKLYDSLRKLGQADDNTAKEFQQQLLNNGLLSRTLNDQLTNPTAPEGTKSLDLTAALLQQGDLPQAGAAEQRARAGINDLKDGVEKAAESVVGDDTAALKLAQSELDAVTDQLKREGAPQPGAPAPAGQGQGQAPSVASAAAGEGQPGQGGQPGPGPANPGQANAPAAGQQAQAGQTAQAGQPGPGGTTPGSGASRAPSLADNPARGAAGGGGGGGAGGDPLGLDNLLGGGNRGGAANGNPITGNGYGPWSDRLRDVEEIVDSPDLRNAVAAARERARLLRQDYTRNLKRPDWAVLQLEVVKPLLEVRDRISDELARRQSKDSLVPIDRDPVPNRYAESVRKYYEELGKDK